MTAPILIFAIGNESRGDDALAPLLARNISNYLINNSILEEVEILEEFQLQIENAMDMKDRRLVLFIDAGMDTPAPFSFYRAKASDEPVLYSHALAPQALLKVYEQFYSEAAPDAFILCIRGEQFKLGEPPSPQAVTHLIPALKFARQRLIEPDASSWNKQCTHKTA